MSDGAGRGAASAPDVDLVEYLMVVVPDVGALSRLAPALAGLVESSAIRILDLVCVTRSAQDGELTVLELEDIDSLVGLRAVEGEVGGLLSDHDIETAALAIGPGLSAILVLVEGLWAESLSAAARRAGGRIIGGEHVDGPRVEAALRRNGLAREGE